MSLESVVQDLIDTGESESGIKFAIQTYNDDDKKVEANSLYERYMELLKSGELLPGVTFQMFEANPIGYDPEAIAKMNKEINKRIAVKKSKEGLAALLAT